MEKSKQCQARGKTNQADKVLMPRAWHYLEIGIGMKKTTKLILSLLLMMGMVWGVTAVNTPSPISAQTALDPRFGAIESFWSPAEAAELGVGWDRILFYWNEIQPAGPNDWNPLHVREEWLHEANANGRQVLGLLKNTPAWATDGEVASGVPRGLYLPINDPGNLWANYVRRVAQYYGPLGVHNWIVWNEPDIAPNVYGHEFAGSTQEYYQLVKVTYQVMKAADPQARIHIGGMTHWHDPQYLRRFLEVVVADPEAAANNYFFDVLTYHIYFRPETISSIVGNGFAIQQQMGINPMKEVWVNETNARPSMDPEWPVQVQAFNIDLEQQAWYVPQAFALGFYAGASHIGVYKLLDVNMNPGDESWGLLRPYDFSKRPAYYAYQNTIKYLAGFQYPIRREQSGNHFVFSFTRPQGVTRVMWTRTQLSVELRLPALAESGVLVDPVTGVETAVTPTNGLYTIRLGGQRCHNGECLMGGPPLFLVEAGVAPDVIPTSAALAVGATTATPLATLGTVTATVGATTTAVTAIAILTPTQTATPRPTRTPSPTPTSTAVPTETAASADDQESPLSAGVSPTNTVPATKVAVLLPTSEPEEAGTAVSGIIPTGQASYWFLGIGVGLGILLIGLAIVRRR